jgi:6-phosphogluconolactonase
MRFTKFGKAFLMSALSAGVIFGLTSCVQSYTVGYLYVTGTNSATTSGNNGIISGFKIEHNKGKLTSIPGLPISTGGSNPVRALLLTGSRFVYVLNKGVNSAGTADCSTADPCSGSNITIFSVGGNGVLASQGVAYYPQGKNPMRMFTDSSGSYLYVLDHDSPDNYAGSYNAATNGCTLALGSGVATCGDISVFKIDADTGRLSTVVNAQVTSATGSALSYFPVPADPIDVALSSAYVLTLSGTPTSGDSVFPYTFNASTGQLTINSNGSQSLGISAATALVATSSYVYVLDNETTSSTINGTTTTAPSGILIYTTGTGGALSLLSGGVIPGDSTLSNPLWLVLESKGKWAYVAYAGSNNTSSGTQQSGTAGFVIDTSTHLLTPEISGSPWGTGASPACLIEDPSHQFFYTANSSDSTVTGRALNTEAGVLDNLPGNANKAYPLQGPATWCITSGRTS